jgi:DNA-binding winged helix-turn-helix (wHTH) protein
MNMLEKDTPSRRVRFGLFELDLTTGELRKRGTRIPLQEQPFQLLAMLVERAGELVTREQLRARLWPGAISMDFDHGLAKAVLKIRRALGDLADSPRYVETLERRGYRFIAAVERLTGRSEPLWHAAAERLEFARLVWAARSIPLACGPNLIGRDAAAAVWVDSPDVSRRHAQVVVTDGRAMVEDLGSKNGTHLNQRRIEHAAALVDGDSIRVGPAVLIFRSGPPEDRTKTAVE